MAYTTINKSTEHFNTKLFTGNGSTNAVTGVGFQPDWTWIKNRTDSASHNLYDAVRGTSAGKLKTNSTAAESYNAQDLSVFGTDGFTVGGNNEVNGSSDDMVSWNWKAGGATPAITYAVKVVSDSGNKFRFDDFGSSAVTLDLQEGGVYTFDQSDSSNSGHPLRFSTTSDGTHGGGSAYTTGVVVSGTPGSSGAKTVITVAGSAPTLYYYCSNHSGMGGQANTNSTFGSSNFAGTTQSTVSVNTTAGFSVVKYTGADAVRTIGHGLGSKPNWIIVKRLGTGSSPWQVYYSALGATKYMVLNSTNNQDSSTARWNDTEPTSSVFTLSTSAHVNESGDYIAYCFTEKIGYSKFGKLNANGSNDNTFTYTGFAPEIVIIKPLVTDSWSHWYMFDNVRSTNLNDSPLYANLDTREAYYGGSPASNYAQIDILSNGFKIRRDGSWGGGGANQESIYMAFGQTLVGTNNIPATAR